MRSLVLFLLLSGTALSAAADRLSIRGVDGKTLTPLAPARTANAVFFVQSDCPISNWYAPAIQQVCRDYAARGVDCTLVYEDVDLGASPKALDEAVRTHLREYRYGTAMPAAVDRARTIATRAKVSVTPQVVVVDRNGIRYRGRIDNAYADLGKPRQHVTSHDLRDALDAVLAGRPVPNPETEALGCFIVDPATLRTR